MDRVTKVWCVLHSLRRALCHPLLLFCSAGTQSHVLIILARLDHPYASAGAIFGGLAFFFFLFIGGYALN